MGLVTTFVSVQQGAVAAQRGCRDIHSLLQRNFCTSVVHYCVRYDCSSLPDIYSSKLCSCAKYVLWSVMAGECLLVKSVVKLMELHHKMNAQTCELGAILNSGLGWYTVNIQVMDSKVFLSFVEMLCRTVAFVKVRVAAGNDRDTSSNTKSPADCP